MVCGALQFGVMSAAKHLHGAKAASHCVRPRLGLVSILLVHDKKEAPARQVLLFCSAKARLLLPGGRALACPGFRSKADAAGTLLFHLNRHIV